MDYTKIPVSTGVGLARCVRDDDDDDEEEEHVHGVLLMLMMMMTN